MTEIEMRKPMRKTRRKGRKTLRCSRKRGGNPSALENARKRLEHEFNRTRNEINIKEMRSTFNTPNKVRNELNSMALDYCSELKMKEEGRQKHCKNKISALEKWLDELIKKNPPSFESMNVQHMSEEEWHIQELEQEIKILPTTIRKLQLKLNSISDKESKNNVNILRKKREEYINKLSALQNQRRAAIAKYRHQIENASHDNFQLQNYSPTSLNNYVKIPVNRTKSFKVMVPPTNEELQMREENAERMRIAKHAE